ncbi:MAG: HAD family hydrolase [Planctomycetota bacterium]
MLPEGKRPKLCIFDLDGTLVDSLPDIAEALNDCLELLGLPTRPVNAYRYLVGEGVPTLCRRALGETHPLLVDRLTELARARYRIRPLKHTQPYPGVFELIGRLHAAGVKLAVLSNKPHELTIRVVQAFWPANHFHYLQGYVEEEYRKPHPYYVNQICRHLGVEPADTWIIGDTPTDIQTAVRSGIVGIGVTWGFRTRADLEAADARYIIDRPEELG